MKYTRRGTKERKLLGIQILELSKEMPQRAIAKKLSVPRSVVDYYLRNRYKKVVRKKSRYVIPEVVEKYICKTCGRNVILDPCIICIAIAAKKNKDSRSVLSEE